MAKNKNIYLDFCGCVLRVVRRFRSCSAGGEGGGGEGRLAWRTGRYMETLPNEQLLCFFMISKLYLLKTKVMDVIIKGNSRPEWSLVLGCCPQQFFLTIYFIKTSVNILWA